MKPERTPSPDVVAPLRADSPDLAPFNVDQELTPLPTIKQAGYTSIEFPGLLSQPLELREDLTSGCGGQTWPAGMVLAKHMLRYHRDNILQARILELGAGGGLVGLAVARECQTTHPIMTTDMADMLSLMNHNTQHNHLQNRVKPSILNWGEPLPTDVVNSKPDVILAADCVYFEPAFPLLMTTLTDLLELCPSATIYFCFKKRRRADKKFWKMAQKKFIMTELVDEDRPIFSRENIFLYALRAKTASTSKGVDTQAQRDD